MSQARPDHSAALADITRRACLLLFKWPAVFVRLDDIAVVKPSKFPSRNFINHMVLTLALLVTIGVITLSERSAEHLLFAIAAFCFNGALLLLVVADVERAVLLSCISLGG